jgi:hypothetical protein
MLAAMFIRTLLKAAPSGINMGTKALEELMIFSDVLGRFAAHLKGQNITYSLQVAYAYNYSRVLSHLYLVDGLK